MIYDVRHVTTYTYAAPVGAARCVLRLTPVDRVGQRVIGARLAITPRPTAERVAVDLFGNRITHVTFEERLREMRIELTARIEVDDRPRPSPTETPPWEDVREAAATSNSLGPAAPAHMLFPARFTPLAATVTDYAAESFGERTPILSAARDLMGRIKRDFAYDPRATDISTPIGEAFAKKRGVCQDFAHIMIAGLRGLGLPAGYVSGYLRTIPPPGKPRLAGADATHAWVDVWCGADVGWIGLDPTNDVVAGTDHIVLAVGRDYADVSPVDGVVVVAGGQKMAVAVDVIPLAANEGRGRAVGR